MPGRGELAFCERNQNPALLPTDLYADERLERKQQLRQEPAEHEHIGDAWFYVG